MPPATGHHPTWPNKPKENIFKTLISHQSIWFINLDEGWSFILNSDSPLLFFYLYLLTEMLCVSLVMMWTIPNTIHSRILISKPLIALFVEIATHYATYWLLGIEEKDTTTTPRQQWEGSSWFFINEGSCKNIIIINSSHRITLRVVVNFS